MTENCKTCGQEIPLIVDIAQALENGLDKDGVPGVTEYQIRQAIRELRELHRSNTRLSDQVIQLCSSMEYMREQYARPWIPTLQVIDVTKPNCHVVKQVVGITPTSPQNSWRVEIR